MSKVWQPQSIEVYKHWVNTIIDEASDDLTEWESDFVDSISHRLELGNNLTEPQAVKLESIYSNKTK